MLGDNVQGQGGEGVGPGHAKEGGFHRMYSGYVSEGLETMVESGPDLHFKTTVLRCLERRRGGGRGQREAESAVRRWCGRQREMTGRKDGVSLKIRK